MHKLNQIMFVIAVITSVVTSLAIIFNIDLIEIIKKIKQNLTKLD